MLFLGVSVLIIFITTFFSFFRFSFSVPSFRNKETNIMMKSTNKDIANKVNTFMTYLKQGKIKCHILPNKARLYDVGEWINEIEDFIEKPIYEQLMKLEGHDIDEEYKI